MTDECKKAIGDINSAIDNMVENVALGNASALVMQSVAQLSNGITVKVVIEVGKSD